MPGETAETAQPLQTPVNPVDRTFLEYRGKLLDVAAFLDRCDRFGPDAADDPRVAALRDALPLLTDGGGDRARRLLERLSDPTDRPLDTAPRTPACGAAIRSSDSPH